MGTERDILQEDRFDLPGPTTTDPQILVSTECLGAVLWESRILGGPLSGETRRYTSKADALQGHADLCAWVQRHLDAWNP